MKLGKTLYVSDRKRWRAWLSRHHTKSFEIWLVYYKKHSGKARIPYNDAVEEALCFGWIDSTVKRIDDDSFAQRFTPRRPGSKLSPMNRVRVARLIAAGKMTRAGLDKIQDRANDAARLGRQKRMRIPADISRALKAVPAAWKHYQRFPDSYRRIRIGWIDGARRRPAEFEKRLSYFVKMTALNKRFGMVQ
jgi:uncharacterized protein YdeI (YjbR/CyaY-like superfamily)